MDSPTGGVLSKEVREKLSATDPEAERRHRQADELADLELPPPTSDFAEEPDMPSALLCGCLFRGQATTLA